MKVRLLIVDDSNFYSNRLVELLSQEPRIEVIGRVSNGKDSVAKTLELRPDVITMDYEMPIMDGISAVKEIMEKCPTPVLMLSALTHDGAKLTLDALEAGAVDYLSKDFKNEDEPVKVLTEKILFVAGSNTKKGTQLLQGKKASLVKSGISLKKAVKPKAEPRKFALVAIGTSTGGPVALQKVLTQLPANFPAPILLIQHMPGTFTGAFAERLNSLCKIEVREAKDGDTLKSGLALLAPGGMQMTLTKGNKVKIFTGDAQINYKPSIDVTFASIAEIYPAQTLAIILTGMGSDGKDGAKKLKGKGSSVWAQDESSSVIFGMPMSIIKANLADEVINLDDLADKLISDVT